jgi:hypothetical protein
MKSEMRKLEESKERLELRVNTWMNWNTDPYIGANVDNTICKNQTDLTEYGCRDGKGRCPGLFDHVICLDTLLPLLLMPSKNANCIVYDFGIRENPEFGETLSRPPFSCQVFAFDPSPTTKTWYQSNAATRLRENPNCQLYEYGAGGINGNT